MKVEKWTDSSGTFQGVSRAVIAVHGQDAAQGTGSMALAGCAASARRLEGSPSFSLGLALMQPARPAQGLSGAFLMQVTDLP